MKNQIIPFVLFTAIIAATFSGCAVVGGIFKAGMGFGIFIVIVIILAIIFLISKMGKSK